MSASLEVQIFCDMDAREVEDLETDVLRVITRLNIGGPARQALLLTRELSSEHPTVLAAGHAPPEEGELDDPSVPVVRVPLVRAPRPLKDIAALRAVRSLIQDLHPRIVHTHMAKAGAVGRLAARRFGDVRTVHTFHGHVLEGYFSSPVERAFIRAERFLAARTDALIAVSDEIRDVLLDMRVGRPEQFHVIPLGFELDVFLSVEGKTGDFRSEIGLDLDTPLVAVIGRVTAIKDHETLLHAVARLPGTHLAVLGDGDRRTEAEDIARALHIADRTHFLGWRHDLTKVLADVDVVALTSRNEGTPVSLIEAAAARRPVVATAVGGTAAVVRNGVTGLLVQAREAEDVAAALGRLLGDPSLAERFGRAGRDHVRERFSHHRLLRDIADLYEDLMTR